MACLQRGGMRAGRMVVAGNARHALACSPSCQPCRVLARELAGGGGGGGGGWGGWGGGWDSDDSGGMLGFSGEQVHELLCQVGGRSVCFNLVRFGVALPHWGRKSSSGLQQQRWLASARAAVPGGKSSSGMQWRQERQGCCRLLCWPALQPDRRPAPCHSPCCFICMVLSPGGMMRSRPQVTFYLIPHRLSCACPAPLVCVAAGGEALGGRRV